MMKVRLLILVCLTTMAAAAQEKQEETANEYMLRSSVAELIEHFESPERDAYQQPRKVLDYLGDIKGKTIMDLGAGSGYFSIKLAEAGAHVIAADVNDEFQTYLKKRLENKEFQNLDIELRKIPFDSPSLEPGEADMVFLVNTYHHIEDRSEYFAKVKEGISGEGSLVIIDYYKTPLPVGPPADHKITMDEIISELKTAGFTHFEVDVNLLPYQYLIKAK